MHERKFWQKVQVLLLGCKSVENPIIANHNNVKNNTKDGRIINYDNNNYIYGTIIDYLFLVLLNLMFR